MTSGPRQANPGIVVIDNTAAHTALSPAAHRQIVAVLCVLQQPPPAGAEFIVVVCAEIMTMPGLPKDPSAHSIDINEDGVIVGLF